MKGVPFVIRGNLKGVPFLPKMIYKRDRAGVGLGGLSPPTFLAVDVRTLNVQLEIFKVLMKDGEFTYFDN